MSTKNPKSSKTTFKSKEEIKICPDILVELSYKKYTKGSLSDFNKRTLDSNVNSCEEMNVRKGDYKDIKGRLCV